MISDTIISAIANLFALFCSRGGVDEEMSANLLEAYLSRHFGIRNKNEYVDLYKDLRAFYECTPDPNMDVIVDRICTGLKSKIRHEEGAMVLLRLMEFCAKTPENFDPKDEIFIRSAQNLGIESELFDSFAAFVMGQVTDDVKLCTFAGLNQPIKTLWIGQMNRMVFSYDGDDIDSLLFNDVPLTRGLYQIWDRSSVLRTKSGIPYYYSSIQRFYEEEKEENGIVFFGRDMNFRFPGTDIGLHDFSFDMMGGQLIAIMGGSGAGKTTLLSLLNGTLRPQSGTVTVNGHTLDEPEVKALIGYVPQDDLLIEELTVYQNLYYTAKLCFEGMPDEEVNAKVMSVLKELGLDQAKDLKVGSPIRKTISGGQRKRLNIALELIREPAVLFLDEPTSGLSSADTEKVILLLKEQTYKGKLIVTNIHQPSSDVFKLFDRLWILDRGGYPIYDGNPIEAITYFKEAARYADAQTSMCPVCGNVNPETILNVVEEKALDSTGQISDARKTSPEEWHRRYLDSRPAMDDVQTAPLPRGEQKKPGAFRQWLLFTKRNALTKITNRQWLLITLLEAPLLALVCALLTRYTPTGQEYSLMENKNLVSFLFMAVIVATFIGMSGSAEEIIKDRALLKREHFLQLSYGSYIASKIALLAVVSLIQTATFLLVGNTVMGLHGQFLAMWAVLFVTAFLSNLLGLLLSQNLNSVVAIYITIPILLIPQILLCGLVVHFEDLAPDSTTGNVPAIGNVIPSRWAYEALAVTTFADNDYERDLFGYDCQKYESQYYRLGYIDLLRKAVQMREADSQNGKAENPHHLLLLQNELPWLAEVCGIPAYEGRYDYTSLCTYLDEAEDVQQKLGNNATMGQDRLLSRRVKAIGKEAVVAQRRNHTNLQLENLLTGQPTNVLCEDVDGHIVPRAGYVYLTPRSTHGNAPFYSSSKRLGSYRIPTFTFNLWVLVLMCVLCWIVLLFNLPNNFNNAERRTHLRWLRSQRSAARKSTAQAETEK